VPVHVTPARRAVALLAAAEHLNNRSRSGRLLLRFSQQNADQIFLYTESFVATVDVSVNGTIFVEQMMRQCGNLGCRCSRRKETNVSATRFSPGSDFSIGIALNQIIEWSKHCAGKWSNHDQQICWSR
jgi:hypothetical protein